MSLGALRARLEGYIHWMPCSACCGAAAVAPSRNFHGKNGRWGCVRKLLPAMQVTLLRLRLLLVLSGTILLPPGLLLLSVLAAMPAQNPALAFNPT